MTVLGYSFILAGLSVLEVRDASKTGRDGASLKSKRKVRKSRQVKITNTHLKNIDLSVDYLASK